jgi:diguanylate cyclase (GGDEF)-like protein
VDQLTATALIVALVLNFAVLVLAFGWAIRNRRRVEPRRGTLSTASLVAGRPDAGPWWVEQADRTPADRAQADRTPADRAQADGVDEDGVMPAADPSPASLSAAEHPRAAEILDALEPASGWRPLLGLEQARVSRYRRSATVVVADLEGIDRLATRLGPESADRLLPAVAGTLRREARGTDRIARLANARFGILLPETDEVAAINWVERVREATDLWLEASAVSLRLAFGWAELGPDADVDAVLALVYERLDAERRENHANPRPDARAGASGGSARPAERRRVGSGPKTGLDRSGSPLAAS